MTRKFLCLLAGLITVLLVNAQDLSLYGKHLFIQGTDTLPYRLLLPENYDAGKKYPLVLFLHGAGERGNNNESQLVHGAKLFLREDVRKDYPAIVIFPQCPANSYWSNVEFIQKDGKRHFSFPADGPPTVAMRMTEALLDDILVKYPVNQDQVYVGGLSMGGMGTFEIVRRHPDLFAAAFPICGGSNPSTAPQLAKAKWWVFHGGKDDIVPPHLSRDMVKALEAAGASVKFTLYPDANHNSWDRAFAEKELMSWLFGTIKR